MQIKSFNSTDWDIFFVEQSSIELSPRRNIAPGKINSTELSVAPAMEHITLPSVASPEPQLITIPSDSNEPTIPLAYGRQDPIVPPSLRNLNMPANPFNQLSTMEVVHPTVATHDDNYSPYLPEPSESFSISTPPIRISTIEGWEAPHTTADDNTFFQTRSQRGSISYHQAHLFHRRPQVDTGIELWKVLSIKRGNVAARLRSLRTDSPYKKEHSRTFYRLKSLYKHKTVCFIFKLNVFSLSNTEQLRFTSFYTNCMWSIGIIPVYWSRLGRKCYGTKRKFTRVYVSVIIYFGGAIFLLLNFLLILQTPPFQKFSAVT